MIIGILNWYSQLTEVCTIKDTLYMKPVETYVPDEVQAKTTMEQFLSVNNVDKDNLPPYLLGQLTKLYIAILNGNTEEIASWVNTVKLDISSVMFDTDTPPTAEQKAEIEKLHTILSNEFVS